MQSAGYTIGNANAPVEVTEFGDFECPACGHFATLTEPDIRKRYVSTGKVLWRFVDFPLTMHRNTWHASRAAACADEQGKFWEYPRRAVLRRRISGTAKRRAIPTSS